MCARRRKEHIFIGNSICNGLSSLVSKALLMRGPGKSCTIYRSDTFSHRDFVRSIVLALSTLRGFSQITIPIRLTHANKKETLMPHNIWERSWQQVGVDIFEVEVIEYLVTLDYFSNFGELDWLENLPSVTIIRKLKAYYARYGCSNTPVSDNGPNLVCEIDKVHTRMGYRTCN